MAKISYKLVFNRKKNLNKEHKALIQIEIYEAGKRKYISTHIYLYEHQWDYKKRMIRKHPNADALNFYLYEKITCLEAAELSLWRQNNDISISNILNMAERKIFEPQSFIEFASNHIKCSNIGESTKKNRLSTIKLLRLFSPHISFGGINENWLYAFEDYLLHVRGLQCNTVAKHLNHIKIYINAAEKKNVWHYERSPFSCFQIRKKPVARAFLSVKELELLETWSNAHHTARSCRFIDAFLFCCYSGLRFSDFCALTSNNFEQDCNTQWLILHTQKTSTEVRLPLHALFHGKCLRLLDKYKGQLNKFFRLGDNSNTNKLLQRTCQQIGIHKHVSFHTARHTFATLLLQQGVNISTVQKLLGHRHIQTTQIYGAVTDRTIIEDLMSAR